MTEEKLYTAIEAAIMRWNLDGTKTAGELTREIMVIVKKYKPTLYQEHRKLKDEWGNTDWRDTGEMGG
jgi:hypothetical protein